MELHDDEVLNAILDGRSAAAPGPNGIRGYPYHCHASLLIPVFQEAFGEIIDGADLVESLRESLLVPIGKVPNPCQIKQIRDLELPNFDEKVLERMFCVILNEQAATTVSAAQCAGLKNRDVADHVLRFSQCFDGAVDSKTMMAVLSLDCSKGFNRVSHEWLRRVLEAARCPRAVLEAIMRMVTTGSATLVFKQTWIDTVVSNCGLRQGGPLSCLLYVIAVDPLLCSMAAVPEVELVLGFVDDWLAATTSLEVVPRLQVMCDDFAAASGQVFNMSKSVILTTRPPDEAEDVVLHTVWPECPIVVRHRIVGVLYGAEVQPKERYDDAMCKFDARLALLRRLNLSLGMRIVAANVFLSSFFSFLNRFFLMPDQCVHQVHEKMRGYITRLSVGSILVWTHCLKFVKARTLMTDIRLQNIAMLIVTASCFGSVVRLAAVTPRWQCNSACCLMIAHRVFYEATGRTVATIGGITTTRLYTKLLEAEMGIATDYWNARLRSRGLNTHDVRDNLSRMPSDSTNHHRLLLAMWLLNGLATSHRVGAFSVTVRETCCLLCGCACDTLTHIAECTVTRALVNGICEESSTATWSAAAHFLQGQLSREQILGILRVGSALWHARCAVARGFAFQSQDDLMMHLRRSVANPFYNRASKRTRHIEPPQPLPGGAVLYRTDGAARGQGRDEETAGGAGAAYFGRLDHVIAWMCVTLGSVTNNVAEYEAVCYALERACRQRHQHTVIETDSMLVCCQLRGEWRIECEELKPSFRQAMAVMNRIRLSGNIVELRHIYREHNVEADALANRGADGVTDNLLW